MVAVYLTRRAQTAWERNSRDLVPLYSNNKISKYAELKDDTWLEFGTKKKYAIPIVLSTTGVNPNNLLHGLKLVDVE